MGVPQTRHRVFFVACRADLNIDPSWLDMSFNYEEIPYKAFKTRNEKIAKGILSSAVKQAKENETVSDAMFRIYGKKSGLTHRIAKDNQVFPTQTAGNHSDIWTESGNHPSDTDVLQASTFPGDFNFYGQCVQFVCGMSVPPIMMKRVTGKDFQAILLFGIICKSPFPVG